MMTWYIEYIADVRGSKSITDKHCVNKLTSVWFYELKPIVFRKFERAVLFGVMFVYICTCMWDIANFVRDRWIFCASSAKRNHSSMQHETMRRESQNLDRGSTSAISSLLRLTFRTTLRLKTLNSCSNNAVTKLAFKSVVAVLAIWLCAHNAARHDCVQYADNQLHSSSIFCSICRLVCLWMTFLRCRWYLYRSNPTHNDRFTTMRHIALHHWLWNVLRFTTTAACLWMSKVQSKRMTVSLDKYHALH